LGLCFDFPGIFICVPVPKLETENSFFARTACASIDRFMLLEHTTAIFIFIVISKNAGDGER
jgi:hypothetical protein